MPLVQIKLIENTLSDDQKQKMIENVTDAVVAVEGENMRPYTWVVIDDTVKSGDWGIGWTSHYSRCRQSHSSRRRWIRLVVRVLVCSCVRQNPHWLEVHISTPWASVATRGIQRRP